MGGRDGNRDGDKSSPFRKSERERNEIEEGEERERRDENGKRERDRRKHREEDRRREGVAEIVRARRKGRESALSLLPFPSSARNRDGILRMAKAAGMVPAVLGWRTNARETASRDGN